MRPKTKRESARLSQRRPGERGRQWQQLLDEKVYPSRAALARAEGVSRAAVTQALARLGEGR